MEFSVNTQTAACIPLVTIETTGNVLPKEASLTLAPTQDTPSDITYLEHYSNPMLAKKLLAHFSDLQAPDVKIPDSFRLTDLKKMAKGKLHDGRDATPEQIELAKEVISRPALMKSLDTFIQGSPGGHATWNNVSLMAEDFKSLSDESLLNQAKVYFREFAAGANDEYVNFNELREAARETRSTRDFSYNATAVAQELLSRPELLSNLDISPNGFGELSKRDNRFSLSNIAYARLLVSKSPHRPA